MKLCLILLCFSVSVMANGEGDVIVQDNNSSLKVNMQQDEKVLTGTVADANGELLPGVALMVKGTTIGTITNFNGEFSLQVPGDAQFLLVSFIGFETQEVAIGTKTNFNVVLQEENVGLEEVVVVGYGVQKKESVVGSITHASGDELQKAGGVTSVGEALQGRLPGVTTMTSSGRPGDDDLKIFIRGQSSWNGTGGPLILVDGTERAMSDIDINEIDQISVLKDASATAVFGVKGGNGVILITTKRGKTGKAKLSLSANTTIKTVSKVPEKLDSYDAIFKSHESIMRELMYEEESWNDIRPMEIINKYRNPATEEEKYQYPNVNWKDELLKDFAQDIRVNLGVRGGSEFAKYFGSLTYLKESDMLDGSKYANDKGYLGEYKYDRFNYRSNIDFKITKSTSFSVNMSGYLGIQEKPVDNINTVVNGLYVIAPNMYTPVYPDGYYGQYYNEYFAVVNPIANLTQTGYKTTKKFSVSSDFILEQKLDFVTKGLSVKGKFSLDNRMSSEQKLNDAAGNYKERIYYPDGTVLETPDVGVNGYDWVETPWTLGNDAIKDDTRFRRKDYEVALNYNNVFAGKHYVTVLGLFKRTENVTGSKWLSVAEDWVSRITYNYDTRYFLDISGAYNGSEKFGDGYKFDLFPSVALGWMASNESFMAGYDWLDKLKFRGSYGTVGDDRIVVPGTEWEYVPGWESGGKNGGKAWLDPSRMDQNGSNPYVYYRQSSIGNPDLRWETATKANIGFELAVLRNKITADFDYFYEHREDILLKGSDRAIPDFFGAKPTSFNVGETEVKGYELVLGVNHTFGNGIDTWAKYSITQARDLILYKDDPYYKPSYQKAEGYPIGQIRTAIPGEMIESLDDLYMSTPRISGQEYVRVGYYDAVDFDGDGTFNNDYDRTPYGHTNRPEKTWNFSVGAGYKGLNLMVEFYGTQNSTRLYKAQTFSNQTDVFFTSDLDYWSKENPDNTRTLPRWRSTSGDFDPYRNYYDGSITRLKTIELSYQIPKGICEKLGVSSLKIFANGNNLYLWTNMPDDREFNSSKTSDSEFRGDYPSMRRYNFGLNLNF